MGTRPESQEQGAAAKHGCSPRRRPRPSLPGVQAARGLPGENNALSSISGPASARTAAGPVPAAPARAWAPPWLWWEEGGVGWPPRGYSPHLQGSLCSLASQAPHRLQAHPGKIRGSAAPRPCWGTRDSCQPCSPGRQAAARPAPCSSPAPAQLRPGPPPAALSSQGQARFSSLRPSFRELGSRPRQ